MEKPKTAIQELVEYFEQQLRLQRGSRVYHTTEGALFDAIEVCKNAILTKEKAQIIIAFNEGYRQGFNEAESFGGRVKDAENYYEDTFKKD